MKPVKGDSAITKHLKASLSCISDQLEVVVVVVVAVVVVVVVIVVAVVVVVVVVVVVLGLVVEVVVVEKAGFISISMITTLQNR